MSATPVEAALLASSTATVQHGAMLPRPDQGLPVETNFNHDGCYRDDLHDKSKAGRQWCREYGPASRSNRAYAHTAAAKPAKPRMTGPAAPPAAPPSVEDLRRRRAEAAERYRPGQVRLLLIAEAPPAAPDRYFYFHDVDAHDSLFRYVARSLLPDAAPTRENKPELLAELRDRGAFLIDLKLDPVDGTPLSSYVPELLRRVEELEPEHIVLIKAKVYDAAYSALAAAGLPVSAVRVPFPGSGQQKAFEEAFPRAVQADEAGEVTPLSAATPRAQPFAFDLTDWFEINARRIADDFDRYFSSFTGRWFEDFAAIGDPHRFEASDLVAVEALSVQVPPEAAAKLLVTEADRFNKLLRHVPRSADMWDFARDAIQGGPADELHTILRTLPGVDWVIAGKLLAAKRPRLIPILDSKVRELLQPPPMQFWVSMWDELSDESRRATIAEVCARAPAEVSLLRRIDIALWMAATQHSK